SFAGALELLARAGVAGEVRRIGVHRTYAVRHGLGPLPTEDPSIIANTSEVHNRTGPWQGPVRKGWLDLVLLYYDLRAAGGVDALVLTHLDALAKLPGFRYADAYEDVAQLALPRDIAEQERLTRLVEDVRPRYASLGPGERERALCRLFAERKA